MDETILDRKLPFSLIAEQSLLGSVLIDPNCFNDVAEIVKSEDFYLDEHKHIVYAVAGDVTASAGKAVDGQHTVVGAAAAAGSCGGVCKVPDLLQREHGGRLAG